MYQLVLVKYWLKLFRGTSRWALLPVNWYGMPNFYNKFMKVKNLKVILNEFSPNTMSNTIAKYIIITFHIVNLKVILNELFPNTMYTIVKYIIITFHMVNKPYPCHPYMFITEIILQSLQLCLFGILPWNPLLKRVFLKHLWIHHCH